MYSSIYKQKLKEQSLDSIIKVIQAKNPEIEKLAVYEDTHGIFIGLIVVKKEFRGQGIGRKLMNTIISYADRVHKPILLTPEKIDGGKMNRLIPFYKSLGFVNNSGRNKDYRFRQKMIRMPI